MTRLRIEPTTSYLSGERSTTYFNSDFSGIKRHLVVVLLDVVGGVGVRCRDVLHVILAERVVDVRPVHHCARCAEIPAISACIRKTFVH